MISVIDVFDEEINYFHDIYVVATWGDTSDIVPIKERLGVEALVVMIMKEKMYVLHVTR